MFFAKEDGGPYGSENISLTPHASCATNHKVIPVGMPFIYYCKNSTSWCLAQDTGGAIVGTHVDVYKGEGIQAGWAESPTRATNQGPSEGRGGEDRSCSLV